VIANDLLIMTAMMCSREWNSCYLRSWSEPAGKLLTQRSRRA